MSPRLVVFGLGNPGPRYSDTRHNLGFRVVDLIALARGVERWQSGRSYAVARVDVEGARVELVKPKTFMNLSGAAVRDFAEDRDVVPGEILVVVDDIALPLGRLRLRRWGSDGGHNGLKSVIASLGTNEFARLRLGVGESPPGVEPAEFVLSPFEGGEREAVDAMVARAVQCVATIVRDGVDRAMGLFNGSAGASDAGEKGEEETG